MINDLRVAAIVCLHFGADYLPYAIRSVADVVDEFIIMYSPVPNHGTYSSAVPCPESRDDLIAAAFTLDTAFKTRWFDHAGWKSEGEQFFDGWKRTVANVILKLDCDEVYPPNLLIDAVNYGIQQNAYEIRLPLRHYWRSFHKAFTHDPAAPGRIYLLNDEHKGDAVTFDTPDNAYRVQHFGYAQNVELIRYKMSIHGHSSQFRQDCDWFNDVFLANRQFDCHPVGSEYWNAETVDVPYYLADHPYANLEVIE